MLFAPIHRIVPSSRILYSPSKIWSTYQMEWSPAQRSQLLARTGSVRAKLIVSILRDHSTRVAAERGEGFLIGNRTPSHRQVQVAPAHRENIPGTLRAGEYKILPPKGIVPPEV